MTIENDCFELRIEIETFNLITTEIKLRKSVNNVKSFRCYPFKN
jgi:hypothetical protein